VKYKRKDNVGKNNNNAQNHFSGIQYFFDSQKKAWKVFE